MKIHKVAAVSSVLLALPFVGFGTDFWLVARAHDYRGVFGAESSEMGDLVFSLGYPLTQIVLKFPVYAGRYLEKSDDWWALPSIVLLFVLQWIIWSQLLAFGLNFRIRWAAQNQSPLPPSTMTKNKKLNA